MLDDDLWMHNRTPPVLQPGTRLRLTSTYDASQRRLGVMGLLTMWFGDMQEPCPSGFDFHDDDEEEERDDVVYSGGAHDHIGVHSGSGVHSHDDDDVQKGGHHGHQNVRNGVHKDGVMDMGGVASTYRHHGGLGDIMHDLAQDVMMV